MYFYKLKNKFSVSTIDIKEETIYYGIKIKEKVMGLRYAKVHCSEKESLFNVIPERYRKSAILLSMESNTYIPPHTDSLTKTTINFYIRPDNCQTNFYSIKNNTGGFKTLNQTTGSTFNLSDLNLEDSFIAEPGDAYLLDVSKPHSVKPLSKITNRLSLCLQFVDYNFEEVLSMIKESNK